MLFNVPEREVTFSQHMDWRSFETSLRTDEGCQGRSAAKPRVAEGP
jgi:hypothetical protein